MHAISHSLAPDDEETRPLLLAGFCQLAETVGPEVFAPLLNDVLPHLIEIAEKKTDLVIGGDDGDADDDDEGWESFEISGHVGTIRSVSSTQLSSQVYIRLTSNSSSRSASLEEKADGLHNLVMLTQALGASFPLATLQQLLEIALPLLKFVFHLGVRQAAAALLAVVIRTLAVHQEAPLSADQRTHVLNTVSDGYASQIASETDPEVRGCWKVVGPAADQCDGTAPRGDG